MDQYLTICAIALTLYDHFLAFDDEVTTLKLLRLCFLTCPLQRFGTFGELTRHGVRSIIRTNRAERIDVQTARQCPTFTSWCVLADQAFRKIADACYPIDRIGPFSPGTSSGPFFTSVVRGAQRCVRNLPPPLSLFLSMGSFTDFVSDPIDFHVS